MIGIWIAIAALIVAIVCQVLEARREADRAEAEIRRGWQESAQ